MTLDEIVRNGRLAQLELDRRDCLESTYCFRKTIFEATQSEPLARWEHQVLIAEALDRVFRGETLRLIINVAPRYGKTDVAVKDFIAKGLAHNPAARFIHLSYSDDLALDNSEAVKDTVKSERYRELFPDVEVRRGSDSKKKWYTTKGGGVYATAAGGQVTGFGAGRVGTQPVDELEEQLAWIDPGQGFSGALIIDDPLKPEDAESEQKRSAINKRFDSTIRSRVNSRKTPMVLIMQRLHPEDLAGHLLKVEPGIWTVLSLPSIKANGMALCPDKHTIDELQELRRIDPVTFERQHMQNPAPREGMLYKPFRTYTELPPVAATRVHVDVADTGDDSLCSIAYSIYEGLAYVRDVIHTKERAEATELLAASQCGRFPAEIARIESNNGGRFFGRNVEALCRKQANYRTRFEYYNQRQNKESRILNNAANVNNFFVMPQGWEYLFPSFYSEVSGYMAVGKNKHDDGPDNLTAIYEHEVTRAGGGWRRKN